MKYPRFTIIIPQKNRAEYLIHTLRTCMIQDYPNLEIIVGDDCSEDNSVEVVQQCMRQDSRIRLIAHEHHVGMRDNFESALDRVQPGYVMALGGDDGLTPGAIWRMYELIQQTGKQLLTWATPFYVYSDEEGLKGRLNVRRFDEYKISILKSEDFLNKIADTLNYLVDDCPMFYVKGVASTDLVDKVKSRTKDGCFYYCPTPDGFSGVALVGEVDDYAYTTEPLSIMGTSTKSQGKNYMRNDEQSKKESQEFFNDNVRRTMHKDLASQPYSPLLTLMTADYLLTARDLPGWPGHFKMFSFDHLLKRAFQEMQTAQYKKELLVRELKILEEISKQHHIESLYSELRLKTKRKIAWNYKARISSITPNMYLLDADQYDVHNIYDASLAMRFAYKAANSLGIIERLKMYVNTAVNIVKFHKYKKESLPNI